MNRETRRLLERQGSISADGTPVAPDRSAAGQRTAEPRASLPQFLREVRAEMRKVTWPGRPEIINYTLVVLFMLAVECRDSRDAHHRDRLQPRRARGTQHIRGQTPVLSRNRRVRFNAPQPHRFVNLSFAISLSEGQLRFGIWPSARMRRNSLRSRASFSRTTASSA